MTDQGKTVVEGSFTGTTESDPVPILGRGTLRINGGIATIQLERSDDGGSNWFIASKNADGDQAIYITTAGTGFNGIIDEPEGQILYRLNCTAYTSETTYRLVGGLSS